MLTYARREAAVGLAADAGTQAEEHPQRMRAEENRAHACDACQRVRRMLKYE